MTAPEIHVAQRHVLNPLARSEQRFKCFRCKRDLPESCFHPIGQVRKKGQRPDLILLHPLCFTCIKQKKCDLEASALYSPALHRFASRLVSTTRMGAKSRGIAFAITAEDVVSLYIAQKGRCALSDAVMHITPGIGRKNVRAMSIDRIDSSANYTLDNVQLVCAIINIMKNDLPVDEFKMWCSAVVLKTEDNVV